MGLKEKLYGVYGNRGKEYTTEMKSIGCNSLWFYGFDEEAFESCAAAGLAACVEFKTFCDDFDRNPHLIPIGIDGKPIRYGENVQGICLSQREYIEQRFFELEQGLKIFTPQGVWLDYLSYAGWFESPSPDLQESCFCSSCVETFCSETGLDVQSPAEIISSYQRQWTDHKCKRIADLGQRFANTIKTVNSDCIVGVYMCPWQPHEFEGALRRIFAQDYKLFSEFTDVFTPLIYAGKSGRHPSWGKEFLKASNQFVPNYLPVQPILDMLDFPESLEEIVRTDTWGFQLFGGADIFDDVEKKKTFAKLISMIKASR